MASGARVLGRRLAWWFYGDELRGTRGFGAGGDCGAGRLSGRGIHDGFACAYAENGKRVRMCHPSATTSSTRSLRFAQSSPARKTKMRNQGSSRSPPVCPQSYSRQKPAIVLPRALTALPTSVRIRRRNDKYIRVVCADQRRSASGQRCRLCACKRAVVLTSSSGPCGSVRP